VISGDYGLWYRHPFSECWKVGFYDGPPANTQKKDVYTKVFQPGSNFTPLYKLLYILNSSLLSALRKLGAFLGCRASAKVLKIELNRFTKL